MYKSLLYTEFLKKPFFFRIFWFYLIFLYICACSLSLSLIYTQRERESLSGIHAVFLNLKCDLDPGLGTYRSAATHAFFSFSISIKIQPSNPVVWLCKKCTNLFYTLNFSRNLFFRIFYIYTHRERERERLSGIHAVFLNLKCGLDPGLGTYRSAATHAFFFLFHIHKNTAI